MDYDKLFIDAPLLGKSIKHRREELGYSQEFLAEQSGLSPNHISRLECGSKTPRLETLMAIAAALDIGIEKLLGSVSETSSEFGKLLSDCSMAERKIILGTAIALKKSLRDNR